jgi:hypothetical protein
MEMITQFLTEKLNNMNLGIQFSENARTASLVSQQADGQQAEKDENEPTQGDDNPLDILIEYVLLFYCCK